MAWTAISGIPPQFSTDDNDLAVDYWLKLYDSGTTTPYSMATDSTGATRLAKCKVSAEGYFLTNPLDDTTVFIPHVDQDYRIVLYRNETDADNNTTANAAFNVDGIVQEVAQLAAIEDITTKGTTLQAQDDYDRSPLFVDGTDFTAGAGPHVITVPADWNPTNADMRFYRLDSSGIVTDLTPTSTTSTTFTLAETLLSTDTIYIGDDVFRNQMDGDPEDIRDRLDVYSQAETYTQAEVDTALSGKIDDGTGTVTATNLDTDSVTTIKIEDDAVVTAKIADDNVTAHKVKVGEANSGLITVTNGTTTTLQGTVSGVNRIVTDSYVLLFTNAIGTIEASDAQYGNCNVVKKSKDEIVFTNSSGVTLYAFYVVSYIDI